jgi:hypothetical protein
MKFVHKARCKRVVVREADNPGIKPADTPGEIWYRVEEDACRGVGRWWEICYWTRNINKAVEIADRVSTFLLEESHTDYKNRIRRKNIKINR